MISKNKEQHFGAGVLQTTAYRESGAVPDLGTGIGAIEGIISIAVVLLAMGVAWGTLRKRASRLEATLTSVVQPNLGEMRARIVEMDRKVTSVWEDRLLSTSSPRQLNARGKAILKKSAVKHIVDANGDALMKLVADENPTSAHDAERIVRLVMAKFLARNPDIVEAIKDGAFSAGADTDEVLLVGSVHLRNLLFPKLGFMPQGLD